MTAVAVDAARLVVAHGEVLQHAQGGRHRDAARGGRWHTADLPAAVGGAQRIALFDGVAGEVLLGDGTRRAAAGRVGGRRHDSAGDVAGVERLRPLRGDGAQRFRIRRIRHAGADGFRAAIGVEEVAAGGGIQPELGVGVVDGSRQSWADVESAIGHRYGRIEQIAPGLLAELAMHVVEQPHDARHPDGAARRPGIGFGAAAVGLGHPAQVVLGRRGRRGFSSVICAYRIAGRVVVQQEAAAADAGGLWFDEAEHGLRGHQRVGRGAAVAQHLAGGFGRQRVGGRHRVGRGADGGHVAAVAGADFGVGRRVPGRWWRGLRGRGWRAHGWRGRCTRRFG